MAYALACRLIGKTEVEKQMAEEYMKSIEGQETAQHIPLGTHEPEAVMSILGGGLPMAPRRSEVVPDNVVPIKGDKEE